MTDARSYGRTRDGKPITQSDVEALAAEAERGYRVDDLIARRPKRGRPALGSGPAAVESVRLDPELRHQLMQRADADLTTPSEIIRRALREFLQASGEPATARSGLAHAIGRPPLTDRQLQVLELMMQDHSTSEIAARLSITEDRVRRHLSLVRAKLEAQRLTATSEQTRRR